MLQQHYKVSSHIHQHRCTEQFILPDTFFKEAALPLVDVLPDPGGKRAALERRRERKVLRGFDSTECQSVNQP